MKKFFFLLLISSLLSSCQRILMKMYGIKNPDVENERSIKKSALKYQLDTTNIVTVCSKDFLRLLHRRGIPDGGIYDRNGRYVEYRQTDTSCNAGLFQFIPQLDVNERYNQPDSQSLSLRLDMFRDLKGNRIKDVKPADFYLLIYWTAWSGKLNKDHVKIWEELAMKNQKCNVQVLKVNMDIQSSWDDMERERIIQAMSKKK